jgi:periplasmic copper chaperone A
LQGNGPSPSREDLEQAGDRTGRRLVPDPARRLDGPRDALTVASVDRTGCDEFVFRAYLTDSLRPDTMLHFPTVQECGGGKVDRWIEIPSEGKSVDDHQYPAPGLKLMPAKATH